MFSPFSDPVSLCGHEFPKKIMKRDKVLTNVNFWGERRAPLVTSVLFLFAFGLIINRHHSYRGSSSLSKLKKLLYAQGKIDEDGPINHLTSGQR